MRFLLTLAAVAILSCLADALTSSLQQVTGFKSGPTSAGMYVYIPTTKVANAPIIVAIHYCSGTAQIYYSSTTYAQLADTYGFIVIFPSSEHSGTCWDVSSTATLTHNGGGDSQTIVNMVSYAVSNYGGDASRVFVTGSSSGAMMTNVLAGAYPDVFKAATVYSGVPDGCFAVAGTTPQTNPPGWNNECSSGLFVQTAAQWGSLVRSYYPGYTGSYPKMQIYHGTSDFTLDYPNLAEELKEWSNVFGVSFTQNLTNTPVAGYTKMVYGDGTLLNGYSALGVGHTVPVRETDDLAWFGIPGGSTTPPTTSSGGSSPTSTPSSTPTSTPGSGSTGTVQEWGQCGGIGWSGATACVSGFTCKVINAYYSQCL